MRNHYIGRIRAPYEITQIREFAKLIMNLDRCPISSNITVYTGARILAPYQFTLLAEFDQHQ